VVPDWGRIMIEITPILDHKGYKPLYIQLSNYIKQEIMEGRIQSNEKLPSKRKLSSYLDVSLNTIQAAYDQLCAEGYVESNPRKGFFVATISEEVFTNPLYSPKHEKQDKLEKKINIDFNSGKVDLRYFPYTVWRKLAIQSLYEDQNELFYNGHPQGDLNLRAAIAKYVFESRGVKCSPEQIVIGAGTQILTGLLCLIVGKQHTYAVENPGFHRTKAVLMDQGVKMKSIPLDEFGICVNQLAMSDASVVYVTPSHQFPNGMVMPITRRMELLNWANEREGYIIEDDYDGEYRYKGKPIPSLQGLDINGRVIYLGTFSKSLIPSIRISFLILPLTLLNRYQDKFMLYKQTVSRLHQDTLFRFMNEGHWQTHLNKMRTLYRRKHTTLMKALSMYIGDNVIVIGEKSGLHILIKVHNGMSEEELINMAMEVGVKVYPTSVYYDDPKVNQEPKILLGFGGLTESEIVAGIQLLKKVWW
jgi:GntR family transcriptional regulator / MocR family aminotransferase